MELKELGMEYERSAQLCRVRLAELRRTLRHERLSDAELIALRRRINILEDMARQTAATGRYLVNYYERGAHDNAKNAGTGISELEEIFEAAGLLGEPAAPPAGRGNRKRADAKTGPDGAHVLFGAALDARDGRYPRRVPLHRQQDAGRGAGQAQAVSEVRR